MAAADACEGMDAGGPENRLFEILLLESEQAAEMTRGLMETVKDM